MNKYLEGGELTIEEIKAGLRQRTIACEIVPAVCGSSFKNKGVPTVLDAVIDYLPAPTEIPPIQGVNPDNEEQVDERHASDDEPFSALAFKIATDPFVGTLTFTRVYSGVLSSGDSVINSVKGRRSAWVGWCRCTPTSVTRSGVPCRRHRRADRHEGRHHG